MGVMNYCQSPIENYECGFFLILIFIFNLQGNYWAILFIFIIFDCELILGLFYIFMIKSYNSYFFTPSISDLLSIDLYAINIVVIELLFVLI